MSFWCDRTLSESVTDQQIFQGKPFYPEKGKIFYPRNIKQNVSVLVLYGINRVFLESSHVYVSKLT